MGKKSIADEVRGEGRWTSAKIQKLVKIPGMHALGEGLYMRVEEGKEPSWYFRYTLAGTKRRPWISIGYYSALPFAEARKRAFALAQEVKDGIDPKESRRARLVSGAGRTRQPAGEVYTVRKSLRDYYDAHEHEWREGKTKKQWIALVENNITAGTLETPLAELNPNIIISELAALAKTKPSVYKKARQRLKRAFSESKARGFVTANPIADMPNYKRPAGRHARPHPSLPWQDVPAFIKKVHYGPATMPTRLALEWAILSGSRPIEVRRATWDQIELENRIWRIPAELMKMDDPEANGDHKVHLTDRHLEILELMKARPSPMGWIWPGQKPKKMMSESVFRPLLMQMGYAGRVTVHGFRATMKTWAIDRWRYDDRVIEAAIAHKESSMERSYNRSDYWPHRVALAEEWARYCLTGEMPPKQRLQATD